MVDSWVLVLVCTTALTVIIALLTRLTTQNEVVRTQRETIDTQRRQLDRLEVAADITEKLLTALPLPRSPGGK